MVNSILPIEYNLSTRDKWYIETYHILVVEEVMYFRVNSLMGVSFNLVELFIFNFIAENC